MTDMSATFINGIKKAWDSNMKWLWCSLHVNEAISRQIEAKCNSRSDEMSNYKNQFNKQISESVEKNKKIIKYLFYNWNFQLIV